MPIANDLFRVTNIEYEVAELAADNFYSTQHVIVLPEDLKPDYYVQLDSSNQPAAAHRPDRMSFRVIADPFGTGDLAESGAANVIVVETGVAVSRAPRLHITLVECLKPSSEHGFRLRDVVLIDHPAPSVSGGHQVVNTATVSNVGDVGQVTVHGIQSGFGMTAQGGNSYLPNLMFAAEMMTSSTELTIKRYSAFGTAGGEADGFQSAHGIIEWGVAWTVNSKTGVLGGGFNGSNAGTGQTIHAAGFDYVPSQTMFFPTFSAQHNVDDINFNGMMLLPHDTSIIYGGTGEIPNPDDVKSSFAMCSWVNGVQFESNIQAVSHPDLHVEHTIAILNDELGDITTPATLTVTGPANGGESDSTGVLGSNIQQGERALSYTFQGEATNTADDNASLVIGLHFNSDTEIELYGADNANPGSAVDVAVQIADFGAIAVALYEEPPEYTDSNSATMGQQFIFPEAGTVVDSATSESGLNTGSSPLLSGRGGLIMSQSGIPSSALDATVRLEAAGDVGTAKMSWKLAADTNYAGADHTLFPWGSRSCFQEKEATRVDAAHSSVLSETYYAVADASDITAKQIRVYKLPLSTAIYTDETLVDTIELEIPSGSTVDTTFDQVLEFGITVNGNGDVFVLSSHTWQENLDSYVELIHVMNVYKMARGESSFVKIASDINAGNDPLGLRSLRFAASGTTLKAVYIDSTGATCTLTSLTNGGSWSRRLEGSNAIPGGIDTGPTVVADTVRPNDLACHDLVGLDDNSGTFYYAYCYEVSVVSTDYKIAVSKSIGSGSLVPMMDGDSGEILSMDQQPENLAAAWHDNGLMVGAVMYSKKSTKESSVMGFIQYNTDFTIRSSSLGEDYEATAIAKGGAILSGMQFCSMAHFRMVSIGARMDVHFCHIDPSSVTDTVMAAKFSMGGWSTHPITRGTDATDALNLNPLSIAYWSSTLGLPTGTSGYSTKTGAGQAWSDSGTALETLDSQGFGALRLFPSTVNTRRYRFTSHEGLGNAFGYKNGFAGGFTVKPSLTPVSYYVEAAGTNVLTADGWIIQVFVDSSNGIVMKSYDQSTSSYVTQYTHATVDDSKYYQIIVGVNNSLGARISHRCLSDINEHSSWETSGTVAAGDDGETVYGETTIGGVIGPLGGANASDHFEFGSENKLSGTELGVILEAWGTAQGDNLPSMLNSSELNIVDMELYGKRTSSSPIYISSGISVEFKGSGGYEKDVFELKTRTDFQKENALESSPRIAWRSTDTTEQSVAMSHETAGYISTHGGIALFGTNFRTAIVEYSTSSSFSSIGATKNLSADITGEMTISSVSGNRIVLNSGHGMTQGEHKGRWVYVVDGSAAGEVYEVVSHPTDDSLSVSTPGSVTSGDKVVVFGSTMSLVYDSTESYEFFRVRVTAQSTKSGHFQIGTLVAGPVFNPGSVPLDWSVSESDVPQMESIQTYSGVEWGFLKGPVRRTVSGRFVGDVNRKRESFRSMVRGLCRYSEKPLAFLLANTSEMTILGLVKDGLSLESEGWYQDESGKWRLAGDMGLTVEEVV